METTPATKSSAHTLATFSAGAPFIAIALCIVIPSLTHGNSLATMIAGFAAILLFGTGLICGIIALIGMRRYGTSGILLRGILGVVFNSVFVVIVGIIFAGAIKQKNAGRDQRLAEIAAVTRHQTLSLARSSFETHLIANRHDGTKPAQPPRGMFDLVHFPSSSGDLAAYVSPRPNDGQKHPAIIWIFGGFDNGIGDDAWKEASPDNDQSASAFRKAGILTMYPSLRGGNDNAGFRETFYGEVEDVLSAYDYLATLDYVDTNRIYLGGHSTGGTLVMLTSEYSKVFRAVFSFGPIANVAGYGRDNLTFKSSDKKELQLRCPYLWMDCVTRPTFVFEGMQMPGNIESLNSMASLSENRFLHFHPVPGKTHFSVLAPATKLVAKKILEDDKGGTCNISFSTDELSKL